MSKIDIESLVIALGVLSAIQSENYEAGNYIGQEADAISYAITEVISRLCKSAKEEVTV